MPETINIHETQAAIDERARQANAERARRYRAAKKADGKPDTNAVDSALGEAVAFLSSIAVPEIRAGKVSLVIDVAELHRMAVINLVRDGSNREYAKHAVRSRMDKRTVHDQPHVMPSRRLSPSAAIIERPTSGTWLVSEIAFVRRIVGRWRDAVTSAKS